MSPTYISTTLAPLTHLLSTLLLPTLSTAHTDYIRRRREITYKYRHDAPGLLLHRDSIVSQIEAGKRELAGQQGKIWEGEEGNEEGEEGMRRRALEAHVEMLEAVRRVLDEVVGMHEARRGGEGEKSGKVGKRGRRGWMTIGG